MLKWSVHKRITAHRNKWQADLLSRDGDVDLLVDSKVSLQVNLHLDWMASEAERTPRTREKERRCLLYQLFNVQWRRITDSLNCYLHHLAELFSVSCAILSLILLSTSV